MTEEFLLLFASAAAAASLFSTAAAAEATAVVVTADEVGTRTAAAPLALSAERTCVRQRDVSMNWVRRRLSLVSHLQVER